MHILLVASASTASLSACWPSFRTGGHTAGIVLALGDDEALREAVRQHAPALVIAPMLTHAIPEDVWRAHTCLIVHPGPPATAPVLARPDAAGRRRQLGRHRARSRGEMDAGDVWAWSPLKVPPQAGKSDLYRGEVPMPPSTRCCWPSSASPRALQAEAAEGGDLAAGWRPFMKQAERRMTGPRRPRIGAAAPACGRFAAWRA